MCCWGWEWCQRWDRQRERLESSMGEKGSSLREMPKWGNRRGSCKPSSAWMVMKSRGHPGVGDVHGLEHCGTCHPTGLLVVFDFCKVSSPGNLKGFGALQDGGRDATPGSTRLLEGLWAWWVCFLLKTMLWAAKVVYTGYRVGVWFSLAAKY